MRDMWTIESSLARGLEACEIADALDLGVKLEECRAQGTGDGIEVMVEESGPSGAEDAQDEFGAEEREAEAVAGEGVSVGFIETCDQALDAKAAEIVGHAAGRAFIHVPANEVGAVVSDSTLPETTL